MIELINTETGELKDQIQNKLGLKRNKINLFLLSIGLKDQIQNKLGLKLKPEIFLRSINLLKDQIQNKLGLKLLIFIQDSIMMLT